MKRKNLIKLLVDNDLSKKETAAHLNITCQHFSLIINGKCNPSFGLMLKFEELCNERGILIDDMWEVWKLI